MKRMTRQDGGVLVETVHYDKAVGGVEVVVNREFFDDSMVTRRLADAQAGLDEWNGKDLATLKREKLAEYQAEKDEFTTISKT